VGRLLAVEGVVGLKFTNFNLYLMEGLLNSVQKPHVFNGHDEVMLAGLTMGAHGGIGTFYNLMPGHFVTIYEAVRAGDPETGRDLQGEVNRLIRIGQKHGSHATVRAILKWQGVDCGDPLRPTRPLNADAQEALRADLKDAELDLF
jgi:N-acetylneuraminate lyase